MKGNKEHFLLDADVHGNPSAADSEIAAFRFSRIFSREPFLWFMLAAFAIVTYVFYNTEFRDTLEDWFFDVRTQWAPQASAPTDIAVVAIDDQCIDALDPDRQILRSDGRQRPYLSIESLTRIVHLLANSEASAIALLLPNHAFPHNDPRLQELVEVVRFDSRMVIGTTEYNRLEPGVTQIPQPLGGIKDRVFGYETFRKRSNVIVRSLPSVGFRGLNEELMLPIKLSSMITGNFGDLTSSYYLNYMNHQKFETINASMIQTDPRTLLDAVRGKMVIVGYTVNRDIPFQTTDMMLVNTPLVGNVQSAEQGMPMTYLVANAVENILNDRTIHPANPVFNFLQTIIVATTCGLVWELGSLTASVATTLIWFLLVYLHAVGFTYGNVLIPLSDTFLASALVSIFAAVRRLKLELQEMAGQQAIADSKHEIARVQSHFLDEFASWLKAMTRLILDGLRSTEKSMVTASPETADLYGRSFAAGEDFSEYLESIRQIPELENLGRRQRRENIDLEDFMSRIIRRFEIKIHDRRIKIVFDIAANAASVKANASLLDSIIFNFISNAIKYSPDGSTIILRTALSRERRKIISVIDEGPGIPPEMREKIFEKFYRIQDDRLYRAKGTGLGLYLCQFFAERMGGKVDVKPRTGQGSEFRVILP